MLDLRSAPYSRLASQTLSNRIPNGEEQKNTAGPTGRPHPAAETPPGTADSADPETGGSPSHRGPAEEGGAPVPPDDRELRQKLPAVFGPHPLGRSWGFKYDTTLGKGINVHADVALVNLNFWITPDTFNTDKDAIYGFLKERNANSIRIPHRCNRAVLFNSAYFHETDEIHFPEGYESRRINITYLFGKR